MPPRPSALLPILLLALSPGIATGAPPAVAELRDLAVLVDRSGVETIESVAAADPDRFAPLPGGALAAGYSRDVHWLRFTVAAPPGKWWLDVLPPYLDDLRLFEPDPARPGSFLERRAGDRLPFSAREVPYRGFVFELPVATGVSRPYYLRVQTTSTAMVVPRLWAPDAFHAAMPAEYGILLGLIAVLLVVALLSVHSWFLLRERVYLLSFAYLAAMVFAFVGVGGFAAQYLLPDHPALTDAWAGAGTMASFAAFALWLREVLQAGPGNRLVHWTSMLIVASACAGILAIPLGGYAEVARVTNLLTLVLILAGLGVTWSTWRRGVPGGTLQLVAIFASLLAFASSLLTLLGIVPGHFLLLYGPNAAVVGSIVALHLAISARHRAIHEERRTAEQDARREREIRERQGKFLDLVAHEYRTPLAVLKTNLDILGLTDEEAARRASMGRMESAVTRLAEILDGHLRQGAWGEDRPPALESLEPAPILRALVAKAADLSTGSAQVVEIRGDETSLVRADRRLLATVFLNLLDNARKYSLPGTPLEIRLEGRGGRTSIRFTNACAGSPGVSTEALQRKYVRGVNADGVPGQGMGLHLVRKLLEDQGGGLELQLADGGRFVAIVTLGAGQAVGAP